MPDDKGVSYGQMIMGLLDRAKTDTKRAKYEKMLECPPLPSAVGYLWDTYWRIRRRKGGNGFGAVPIEWGDLADFRSFSGMIFAPWEAEVIEDLDDMFMAAMTGRARDGDGDSRLASV